MAGTRGDKLLRPGEFDQRRSARAQGHQCRDIFEEDFLLCPKPAADPRLDHADIAYGIVKGVGNDSPHMERHLGRGP